MKELCLTLNMICEIFPPFLYISYSLRNLTAHSTNMHSPIRAPSLGLEVIYFNL